MWGDPHVNGSHRVGEGREQTGWQETCKQSISCISYFDAFHALVKLRGSVGPVSRPFCNHGVCRET